MVSTNSTLKNGVKSLKNLIERDIEENPILVERSGVKIKTLDEKTIPGVISLYKETYERDPWFFYGFEDPKKNFLNNSWLIKRIDDPNHIFLVFTGLEGEVFGSTSLVNLGHFVSIDWTQIAPKGRRKLIMESYYRRFVPLLDENKIQISTEFVLNPESGSLRRILIGELEMISIGILPHILTSEINNQRRSEITAVKSPNIPYREPLLIPEANVLYNIVAEQINRPKKREYPLSKPILSEDFYSQKVQAFSNSDLNYQRELYESGLRPLVYNPITNVLTMGRIPESIKQDDLSFIRFEQEKEEKKGKRNITGMRANTRFVDYLNSLV
ncbi:hypothetical protein HYX17_05435 [Candidatus Woesearchaeota archaeon]|nr:hypothetical protein [Candidatus Woesearchaeota archaeon]